MASPQKENGYTAIANEIMDHLSFAGINGSEYRIIFVVLRKTYGFQKTRDKISLSQFQKYTLMKRNKVVENIQTLVTKRVLLKENNLYKFNKNWEEWVVTKRVLSTQKGVGGSTQKGVKSSTQKGTYKRKKETITKEIVADATKWAFEEELGKLKNSPRKDYKIIALFWKKKGYIFENQDQFNAALRRELKAAKDLKGYSGDQIARGIAYCEKEYPNLYTLETIFKRITDLVNTQ